MNATFPEMESSWMFTDPIQLLIGVGGGLIWAAGYHWVLKKIVPVGINRYLFLKGYELLTIGALLELLFLYYSLATPLLPPTIGNRTVAFFMFVTAFIGLHMIFPYFLLISRSKLAIRQDKLPKWHEYFSYVFPSGLISAVVVKSFRLDLYAEDNEWYSQIKISYLYSIGFLFLSIFGLRRIWISRVSYQLDIVEKQQVIGEYVEIYGKWVEMYDKPEQVVEQVEQQGSVNPVLVFVII